MKILCAALLLAAASAYAAPVPIKYDVIFDRMTFLRPEADKPCCVWTDDAAQVAPLLAKLGIKAEATPLPKGGIVVVFFNDNLTDKLNAITRDAATGEILAEYKPSGIMFKLKAPPEGMKYTHVTAVSLVAPEPFSISGIAGPGMACTVEKFTRK